jgi:hypothetical protein
LSSKRKLILLARSERSPTAHNGSHTKKQDIIKKITKCG